MRVHKVFNTIVLVSSSSSGLKKWMQHTRGKEGEKCWVLRRPVVTCRASLCRPSDSWVQAILGPNSEMPNPGIEESGEMPGWSGLSGWIVGLLTTYMTSVARVAGHWVLGCRDCLGKLLRQQGRQEARLVGALGSEANREAAAWAWNAHTFPEFLAPPTNAPCVSIRPS